MASQSPKKPPPQKSAASVPWSQRQRPLNQNTLFSAEAARAVAAAQSAQAAARHMVPNPLYPYGVHPYTYAQGKHPFYYTQPAFAPRVTPARAPVKKKAAKRSLPPPAPANKEAALSPARAPKTPAKKKAAKHILPPSRTSLRTKGKPPEPGASVPTTQGSPPLDLNGLVGLAVTTVTSQPHLREKWLTQTGLFAIIQKRYKFEGDFELTSTKRLHKAVTKLTVGCADIQNSTNQTGIFRFQRKQEGKANKIVWFYYVTDPGKPISPMPHAEIGNKRKAIEVAAVNDVNDAKESPRRSKRQKRPDVTTEPNEEETQQPVTSKERKAKLAEEWKTFFNNAQAVCDKELQDLDSQKDRPKDRVDVELERAAKNIKGSELEKKTLARAKKAREEALERAKKASEEAIKELQLGSYFDSGTAKRIFCPKDNETVRECLSRRIVNLSMAIMDPNGYEMLLKKDENADENEENVVSEPTRSQLFEMRDKAMALRLSYKVALEEMDKGSSFTVCCKKACDELKRTAAITHGLSAQKCVKLNKEFRHDERFLPPQKKKAPKKKSAAAKKTNQKESTSGDAPSEVTD